MSAVFAERSVTGVRSYGEAVRIAVGLSGVFEGESFVVVHFPSEGVFDVEPALPTDALGVNQVVAVATVGDVQEFRPGVD